MKKISLFLIIASIGLVISSCQNSEDKKVTNEETGTTAWLNDSISYYERVLFANANIKKIDRDQAIKLADYYIQWAKENFHDSLAPDYALKAGDILMNVHKPVAAIKALNRVIKFYPDHKDVPYALFLKAFVYEDQLNDEVNSKHFYEEFLEKYPDNEYADDARLSLQNLGKSPEELIKEFENK